MNNEPVAWLNYKGYLIDDDDVQRYKDEGFVMTPLYTHPAKTLTDDEYDNIFANGKRLGVLETEDRFCKAKTLTDEEIADMVCSGEYWELSEGQVIIAVHFDKFARAILKKAGEK